MSKIPETPEPPEVVEPIYEWQKYLDDYEYDPHKMHISEDVAQIKSLNLDSDMTTLDKNLPKVDVDNIAKATNTEHWSTDEIRKQITKQIHNIAIAALLEYDRNPDDRQAYLIKIIRQHITKRFLLGKEIEEADEKHLRILWAMVDQIHDIFLRPELIEGVLTNK